MTVLRVRSCLPPSLPSVAKRSRPRESRSPGLLGYRGDVHSGEEVSLQAAVDLVRAERDDALGCGGARSPRAGPRRRGRRGPASSRRSSRRPAALAFEVRTRTPQLPGDQGGDLGAAQPRAERQRLDRGVSRPRASAGRRRLPAPSAVLVPAGCPHQVERRRVGRARRPGAGCLRGGGEILTVTLNVGRHVATGILRSG